MNPEKTNTDQENLKTCLVTGAAGFMGSHLVDFLIKLGYDVIAVDDLSGGYAENVNPLSTFYIGDVTSARFVNNLFEREEPDYVFHLAAYAAEGLSHFIRNFNYKNNLIGTTNIVNASVNHGVQHLVFTSSIAVYGHPFTLPVVESMCAVPADPYGIAKLAAEADIRTANEMWGLPYTIFRPHNVYGPRQNIADKYRNVIGIFMNQILNDEPLTIFGHGDQTRAFTHVSDVIRPIGLCIENEDCVNKIFNVGSDEICRVIDLADLVRFHMGKDDHPIKFLEQRNEVKHVHSDHSQLDAILGKARKPLADGLKEMSEWVKKHGSMEPVGYDKIEVIRNLPPSWLEQLAK